MNSQETNKFLVKMENLQPIGTVSPSQLESLQERAQRQIENFEMNSIQPVGKYSSLENGTNQIYKKIFNQIFKQIFNQIFKQIYKQIFNQFHKQIFKQMEFSNQEECFRIISKQFPSFNKIYNLN